MSDRSPISLQRIEFEKSAEEYLRWLREEHPEHFMESTAQAQQRKIFVVSFDLIAAADPKVHPYNELLVQWRKRRKKGEEIRQVVPDNMVVVHDGELKVFGSFDIPLQPARPFWVLEYVSKGSQRKDYEVSHAKYEQELKVPYYLTFYPEIQEMTLHRLGNDRYGTVVPDENGRCAVPELGVEVGLVEGWVRFWHHGRLLPLPPELQRENNELRRTLDEMSQKLDAARQELGDARQELGDARQELGDARQELGDARRQLEDESRRANLLQQQLDRLLAKMRPEGADS